MVKMCCSCNSVQFKRMLSRELTQFAESGSVGTQISEYICHTFLGKFVTKQWKQRSSQRLLTRLQNLWILILIRWGPLHSLPLDSQPVPIAEFAAKFLFAENPPEKFEYPNYMSKSALQ